MAQKPGQILPTLLMANFRTEWLTTCRRTIANDSLGRKPKRFGLNIGGKTARIGRNRQQWTTVKWLNRQERPIKVSAHNPKVGGSNPSPAIEGRLNKPPFSSGLEGISRLLKTPQRLGFHLKICPRQLKKHSFIETMLLNKNQNGF